MAKLILEIEGRQAEAIAKAVAAEVEKLGGKCRVLSEEQKKLKQQFDSTTGQMQRQNAGLQTLLDKFKRGEMSVQQLANAERIASEAARLHVDVLSKEGLQLAKLIDQQDKLQKELRETAASSNQAAEAGRGLASVGEKIGAVFAGLALGAAVKKLGSDMLAAVRESEAALAQLEARVKSTGGTAGFTASQLEDMASRFSSALGIDDEALAAAEARLLTFEDVAGSTFERVIGLSADLSVAMGTDITAAVTLIGKAAQEPEEALSQLSRAIGKFTDEEEKAIIGAAKMGDEIKAQALLLDILERRVGGTAAAYRDTLGGALDALAVEWENVLEGAGASTDGLRAGVEELILLLRAPDTQRAVSDLAKMIGEGMAAAAKTVVFLAKHVDDLKAILAALIAMRIAAWLISLYQSSTLAAGGFAALRVAVLAFATNPATLAIAAIGAIVFGLVKLIQYGKEAQRAQEDYADALSTTIPTSDRYNQLQEQGAKAHLKAALAARMRLTAELELAEEMQNSIRRGTLGVKERGDPNFDLLTDKSKSKADDIRAALERNRDQILKLWEEIRNAAGGAGGGDKDPTTPLGGATSDLAEKMRESAEATAIQVRQLGEMIIAVGQGEDAVQRLTTAHQAENAIRAAGAKLSIEEIKNIQAGIPLQDRLKQAIVEQTQALADRNRELEIAQIKAKIEQKLAQPLPLVGGSGLFDSQTGAAALKRMEELGAKARELANEADGYDAEKVARIIEINRLAAGGLITQEQANILLREHADLWVQVQDESVLAAEEFYRRLSEHLSDLGAQISYVLAGELVDAIRTGTLETERLKKGLEDALLNSMANLIQEWLAEWFKAMAQWLARWIATQAAAKTASAALGSGGGGVGGVGADIPGLAFGTYAKTATPGVTGGGMGTAASIGAVAAIYAAVYLGAKAWVNSHKEYSAEVTFKLNQDVGALIASVHGDTKNTKALTEQIQAMGRSIADWIASLGGAIEWVNTLGDNTVTVGRKGRGKDTAWFVELANGVREWFSSQEEAFSFAMVQALKEATISGLDPIVAAAIKNSTATTMEELQKGIADAVKVASFGQAEATADFQGVTAEMDRLRASMRELIGTGAELYDALAKINAQEILLLQSQRDAITGKQRTAEEEYQMRLLEAKAWNAEREVRLNSIALQILEIKTRIENYKATRVLIDGGGAGSGVANNGGLIGLGRTFAWLAGVVVATSDVLVSSGDAQLDALNGFLKSLEDLYNALKAMPPIDPSEVPYPTPARGGGSRGPSSKDEVRDFIKEKRLSLLPDLAGEIERLNREYDEQIKKAKGNADLIRQLNNLRQREIDIIRDRVRAELITPYLGKPGSAGRSDFLKEENDIKKQYDDLRKNAKVLGIVLWQVNQAEKERIRLLQLQAAASAGSRSAATRLEMEKLAEAINYLRLRAAENAGLLKEIADEQFLALGDRLLGFLDKYYGDVEGFEDFRLQLEQVRFDLEFANMQLQFQLIRDLGILTDEQIARIEGVINYIRNNPPTLVPPVKQTGGGSDRSKANDDLTNEINRLREAFKQAKDGIREFLNSLDRGDFGGISPISGLEAAQRQYNETLTAARAGNLTAFQSAPEAAQNLIDAMKSYSPALFAVQLPQIRAAMENLLTLQTVRDGNLVVTERFERRQQHQENVETLRSGFSDLSNHAAVQEGQLQKLTDVVAENVARQREINATLARITQNGLATK